MSTHSAWVTRERGYFLRAFGSFMSSLRRSSGFAMGSYSTSPLRTAASQSTSLSIPTAAHTATGSANTKTMGSWSHGLACVSSIMSLKLRPHELSR